MSKLTPTLPFKGFTKHWEGVSLSEAYSGELVSLAVPHDGEKAFKTTFKAAFGTALPKPNAYVKSDANIIMWSGAGQYLVQLDREDINADHTLARKLKDTAYTTLQSDGWVRLTLSGDRLYEVLERFTALNLRNTPDNFATRTIAHHIAVIFIKTGPKDIILLSPRSSAQSFLETLTHTIENVMSETN